MSSNADPVARFAGAAERYVAWVEGPRIELEADLHRGYALLLELMSGALTLPDLDVTDVEPTSIPQEDWLAIHRGFTWVPVQYYWEAELEINGPQQLMVGDLHDDLADIWGDVKPGLELHRAGHTADACFQWKLMFGAHWGEHAADAVRVMTKMEWHRGG